MRDTNYHCNQASSTLISSIARYSCVLVFSLSFVVSSFFYEQNWNMCVDYSISFVIFVIYTFVNHTRINYSWHSFIQYINIFHKHQENYFIQFYRDDAWQFSQFTFNIHQFWCNSICALCIYICVILFTVFISFAERFILYISKIAFWNFFSCYFFFSNNKVDIVQIRWVNDYQWDWRTHYK